jgi:hypothetical protein
MAAWFPQTAPHYAELAGVSEEVAMIDRFTVAGPAELWVQRIKELAMVRDLAARVLPHVRNA